jgi:hypothetical protein
MMHNEIYDCLLLLPPFHISVYFLITNVILSFQPPFHISVYFLITNVILSFQQTKAVRMEQTSDGTILKSPFSDQVMKSS